MSDKMFYCKNCGSTNEGIVAGSGFITLFLLLWLIFPGILYEIWRGTQPRKCKVCKAAGMIPANSPIARGTLNESSQAAVCTVVATEQTSDKKTYLEITKAVLWSLSALFVAAAIAVGVQGYVAGIFNLLALAIALCPATTAVIEKIAGLKIGISGRVIIAVLGVVLGAIFSVRAAPVVPVAPPSNLPIVKSLHDTAGREKK